MEEVGEITEICKYALDSMNQESQNKVVTHLNTMFGNQYLYHLVCWSDLFGQPWSCCNVSEARNIIQNARVNLIDAEVNWGRFTASTDLQHLQISESDCKGMMMGSMTFKALRFAQFLMESISPETSDGLSVLFRTHVAITVSTISLHECADDPNACVEIAENTKHHIDLLQKIDPNNSVSFGWNYLRS